MSASLTSHHAVITPTWSRAKIGWRTGKTWKVLRTGHSRIEKSNPHTQPFCKFARVSFFFTRKLFLFIFSVKTRKGRVSTLEHNTAEIPHRRKLSAFSSWYYPLFFPVHTQWLQVFLYGRQYRANLSQRFWPIALRALAFSGVNWRFFLKNRTLTVHLSPLIISRLFVCIMRPRKHRSITF